MPKTIKVSPFNAPNYDVFSPARRQDERGVILGVQLDGGQNYVPWIGLSTVRELALKHSEDTGLVDAEELELAVAEIEKLEVELAEAKARLEELELMTSRIAGLSASGFTVNKVKGRPPKAPEAVSA